MSKSTPQDATDAELSVMKVLWQAKTATVRAIAEELYKDNAKSQHATVQKLLDRLKAKGFVARDKTVWPHLFRPAIQQDELIDRRLQNTADKFCGGSMQPLLTHLLRGRKLSKSERASLRKLLDGDEDGNA
jgi:predicted transcriptional regulator